MHDSRIFYRLTCFMLFMNVPLSNAVKERITNPNETFEYIAPIHSLFMIEPNQNDFTQYSSTKQLILGLHTDCVTLSFYEMDAPYTFLTFRQRHVNFELFYAQTMMFTVEDGKDLWHFQCVFSADKDILDIMHSYLSLCSAQGCMEYQMDIDKVESYVKTGPMENPVIQTVEDLEPACLFDQEITNGDPSKKIYGIALYTSKDEERIISRLVFRTGDFKVFQVKAVVVLKLSALATWYHIFYFRNTLQADKFMRRLAPSESLDLPSDVLSYAEIASSNIHSQSESDSDSESAPSPDRPSQSSQRSLKSLLKQSSRKQPQSDEVERTNKRGEKVRPRTVFTIGQMKRLLKEFHEDQSLPEKRRRDLAIELGLPENTIKIWFQNRRSKLKRAAKLSDTE